LPGHAVDGFQNVCVRHTRAIIEPVPVCEEIRQVEAEYLCDFATDRSLSRIEPEDGGDKIDPFFPGRDLAEDVHPDGNSGALYFREGLVRLPHHLFKRRIVRELQFLFEPGCLYCIHDHVLEGMGPGRIVFCRPVLPEQAFELFEFAIEPALRMNGLHVIAEDRIPPAFRNGALGGVVCVVHVQERGGAGSNVRETLLREADAFTGQELQVPVRSDLHDHIGAKDILDPVVGCEVLVRGRAVRVVEHLTDRTVAPCAKTPALGLDVHGRVSKTESRDEDLSLVYHARTGRLAPRGADFFLNPGGQGCKPPAVRGRVHLHKGPAFCYDILGRCPPELRDRFLFKNLFYEIFSRSRNLDVVTGLFHMRKDPGNAFDRVEVGCCPDVCISVCTGIVVEDERDLTVGNRFLCKGNPFFHPGCYPMAALFERYAVLLAVRAARPSPDVHRLDHAFELRHRNSPAHIEREPGGFAPLFDRFVRGDDRGKDRYL